MVSAASSTDCANGGVAVTDGYGNTNYACNGVTGAPGPAGPAGPAGPIGDTGPPGLPGTGATVAAVASGDPTCPDGGASVTDGSGDEAFACNGAPGPTGPAGPAGPAGTAGQNGESVYGEATLHVSPTQSLTDIPGLSLTISVPANSFAYISTGGGVQVDSTAASGWSDTGIFLLVDGAQINEGNGGGDQLVEALNNDAAAGAVTNWSLSSVVTLSAGLHTIDVAAGGEGGNSDAYVSESSGYFNQGALSVLILGT
jgi:hypothetical protein